MASFLFLQKLEYEFLDPKYNSAIAKRYGHQCRLAIGQMVDEFCPVIEKMKPDVVNFSVMSGSRTWALTAGRFNPNRSQKKTLYDFSLLPISRF